MNYFIRIGTQGDTRGVDQVTNSLKRADQAADDFVASIKAGVGIDLGGKLVNSVAAIPGLLQSAISRGVEFNMQMQNSEVGIANVLAKFMDLDAVAAKREAAKAMQQIIELEPKTAGGLSDLVQGFMATVAAAQSAGVSVEQNIDLVGRFANAMMNANIPAEQLAQELRSIMTGNITSDSALAKILQISNEDVNKAKEAGNLYQVLVEKIGTIGNAGDSAAVRMSSFNSAVDKLLGQITKPIFDAFIDGVLELTQAIESADKDALKDLGFQIASIVRAGASLTQWATENNAAVLALSRTVGYLAAAWGAFQIAALLVGLTNKARAILANKTALDAENASLGRNTALQSQNAAAAGAAARSRGAGMGAAAAGRAVPYIAGAAVGVGIGYDIQANIFNHATSRAFGGASTEADLQKTNALLKERMELTKGYISEAKSMTTEEQRADLLERMTKNLREMAEQRGKLGWNEQGQKNILDAEIKGQERLLETIKKLSLEKAQQAEREKEIAAAAKKQEADALAAMAANAEKDAAARADFAAKRASSSRGADAAAGADIISRQLSAGDISGARQSMDSQEAFYQDWMSRAKAEEPGLSGDALKANLAMQEELQGYLDAITKARMELPEAIVEAEKKATEEKVKALEQEKAVIEANGKLRLAEIDGLQVKDEERARLRKAAEDEIAAKRLALENQIGELQKETDLQRQARQIQYNAEQISRDNQLADATRASNPAAGTQAGELFPGTRRRRGAITSDSFEQSSGVEAGNFARPLTDFGSALGTRGSEGFGTAGSGFVPPASVPPPTATPGANPAAGNVAGASAASGSGGQNEAAGLKSATEEQLGKLNDELRATTAALQKLGSAATSTLKQHVSKIAQIEREIATLRAGN